MLVPYSRLLRKPISHHPTRLPCFIVFVSCRHRATVVATSRLVASSRRCRTGFKLRRRFWCTVCAVFCSGGSSICSLGKAVGWSVMQVGSRRRWHITALSKIVLPMAVVTCEIKLFQNYFSFRRRSSEIILFQRVETCLKPFRNYLHEYCSS